MKKASIAQTQHILSVLSPNIGSRQNNNINNRKIRMLQTQKLAF